MSTLLPPAAARRTFLTLSFTRWFSVGLVVGIFVLWILERGLTISEAAFALSFTGIVVFLLELPTSGFADAFGRRPVYVASAVVGVLASLALLLAHSFVAFVVASVLMGIFRALDSGPLEAWFVDTVHATEPDADVDGALAAQGTVVGVAIAVGALISGGLIWWHPVTAQSALWLPVLGSVVLSMVHLVMVLALLKEPRGAEHLDASGLRRAVSSAKDAPAVVREGLGMVGSSGVLRGLLLAEVAWSIAMVVFEMFQPVRLAELLGSEEAAGAWMGPIAAGGWAVFAAGSALAGLTSKRLGVARTAMLGRVLNSLGALVMGLVAGPVALVVAYAFTYSMHGFLGPMHAALLHRVAEARNRATILSMNSMTAFAAFSIAAPLLGVLADGISTQAAMVLAGVISLLGLLAYLPARRAELTRSKEHVLGTAKP
ncbi:MAG TPA: MFS transporter [Intrasporangium sp.]|uniref:MFS transporter n=1 Tax=Intrasporangium sp. TaxID=1925024 RepID=UPI002B4A330F|nr:MFS transporter [Intrasporangium sp.]HKX67073.1 MFS transporter [Intrasporangium sp.]